MPHYFVMLSVIMLNAVMQSVVAPSRPLRTSYFPKESTFFLKKAQKGSKCSRHDIQHADNQHKEILHTGLHYDTLHKYKPALALVVMLMTAAMLIVALSVVMLNVTMLNVAGLRVVFLPLC
jgi:hypothetical protein